jgi:hypothetical protein
MGKARLVARAGAVVAVFGSNPRRLERRDKGAGDLLARHPMANCPAMSSDARIDTPGWLVACLCAGWCRTCDGYLEVMQESARLHPGWRFAWVDIEDHADALDDAKGAADDIETFPTLLVALGGQAHFFGPVLPHAGVLARLLAQAEVAQLPVLTDARVNRIAAAVAGLWADGTAGVRVAG